MWLPKRLVRLGLGAVLLPALVVGGSLAKETPVQVAGPRVFAESPCRYVPVDDPNRLPCEVWPATGAALEPEETLRVVTYNVHYGDDVPALADAITANPDLRDADVLLLQEIESYPAARRVEQLASRLGLHAVYAPARAKGQGTHGLAILSRYPLRDPEVLLLPQFELGFGTRQRVALAATVSFRGTDVWLADVHLDTRLTIEQRRRQMKPVLERAAEHSRAVIGGDLNTISCVEAFLPGLPILFPGTSQGPRFDAFMREAGFATPFHGIGWTGPLHQRLDAIFVRGLGVGAVGKEEGMTVSDHLPLWADITGNLS